MPSDGPRQRCDNPNCVANSPRTDVLRSWRKTIYRCPECGMPLRIDDRQEVAGDD